MQSWDFPGWGEVSEIDLTHAPRGSAPPISHLDQPKRHMLSQWSATAICGNDITSSVLYVSALCAAQAGALAPLVLLLVGGVLYLYRRVYAEVGSALPMNGGTYTVLLNTTSKRIAAGAACLTLLSYLATAVISAEEAMDYAQNLAPWLSIVPATIALLGAFATLTIVGVGESAVVALVIFAIHIGTLLMLSVAGIIHVAADPTLLRANWSLPSPRGFGSAIVFGFAVAMLGISGFESSANFIEEQKVGVFPKTLRNMWVAVVVFNPLVSLLSLGLLPLDEIRRVPPDLLARMGQRAGFDWMRTWVSVDAVLVLSGAVLTSYVGVTGLVRRMALDRCLPRFLLRENAWRGTNHWIAIGFFALCTSILLTTGGAIPTLAGVYALSFLSVMALFAIGNLLLKRTRGRLPREVRASPLTVLVALAAVLIAIGANVALDPGNARVFTEYAVATGSVVAVMLFRVRLLSVALSASRHVTDRAIAANEWVREHLIRGVTAINAIVVVYFTRGDSIETLEHAAEYVLRNEQTDRMTVVHVYEQANKIPPGLAEQLTAIDRKYPRIRIDLILVRGVFSPALVERLSREINVPRNLMFIGTPGDRFPHRIETLGGVRVIL